MRELKILTFRHLPSHYHKQAWVSFEQDLVWRSLACLIGRNLFSILQLFSKLERYDYTERLLQKDTLENAELVKSIFPHAKLTLQVMLVARFILLLGVLKWGRLVRISIYLDLTIQIVEAFLPTGLEFGQELLW